MELRCTCYRALMTALLVPVLLNQLHEEPPRIWNLKDVTAFSFLYQVLIFCLFISLFIYLSIIPI